MRGTLREGFERRSGTRASRRGCEPGSRKIPSDGTEFIRDRIPLDAVWTVSFCFKFLPMLHCRMEGLTQGKEEIVEYLDVYDENNEPLARNAPRDVVHAEGLWHHTVHIYAWRTTPQGPQILAHLRSKNKKQYPGRLDPVFGGHVKSGRSERQTVIDELQEETGIRADSDRLQEHRFVKKDDPISAPNDREFNMIFTYELNNAEVAALKLDPEEVESTTWLSPDQMRADIADHPETWRPSREELDNGLGAISVILKK